jgi:hypothetical protein
LLTIMRSTLLSSMRNLSALARPLGWATLLWSLALLLPWLELRSINPALDTAVVRTLVLLPPLASLWAALTANSTTLLGVALAGVVPALVAVPELADSTTGGVSGAIRGAAIALVLLIFIASSLDLGKVWAPLHTLWRWPARWPGRALQVLGVAWLLLAWVDADGHRSGRVAAAAVCWVAVVVIPIGAGHQRLLRHGWRWLFARGLWVGVVLLIWRYGKGVL